jgi:hypothetical protein
MPDRDPTVNNISIPSFPFKIQRAVYLLFIEKEREGDRESLLSI